MKYIQFSIDSDMNKSKKFLTELYEICVDVNAKSFTKLSKCGKVRLLKIETNNYGSKIIKQWLSQNDQLIKKGSDDVQS